MKRYFTLEMRERLAEANELVKGKMDEYLKYQMEIDYKNNNGKWIYVGHGIPYTDGIIKSYKDNTYIVVADGDGECKRYLVTDGVKQLLNI